jgi:peptidoglycan/xylan/chitin deacetylase (PgdA/CDA1 family)
MKNSNLTRIFFTFFILSLCVSACREGNADTKIRAASASGKLQESDTSGRGTTTGRKKASMADILSRRQIPVLCYHRIRPWTASDGRIAKDNVIPPDLFKAHMRILADSGYHSIMPDQLLDHLEYGDSLPEKPVMISFDDGSIGQYDIGVPTLEKHGFRGVFFIMTIATGRKGYMSSAQLKEMTDRGHLIASHTWDHHSVLEYDSAAWDLQLTGSVKKLESITGKPVRYFAYPFGLWSSESFPYLRSSGMRGAFILATKRDSTDPLMTLRRINVPGYWNEKAMLQNLKRSFK